MILFKHWEEKNIEGRLLSTADLSKLLGVDSDIVEKWINQDGLKTVRTGEGNIGIRFEEFLEFARKNDLVYNDKILEPDGIKVLIVDDNKELVDVLSKGLGRINPATVILTAHDGEEAYRIMSKSSVEVVVLDICLPKINGFELCSMIKKDFPGTRIIAMTGADSKEIEDRILENGADAFLPKPFEFSELIEMIHIFCIRPA